MLSTQLTQNTGVTWILRSVCYSSFLLEHFEMPDFKYQASKTIVKSDLGLHTLVLFSLFIDKASMYFVNVVQNVHTSISNVPKYIE